MKIPLKPLKPLQETKSKNIEMLFEKNLINKTLAKVSCKGNDYYEFTKDIQILNRIRKKYPFILKNYNELIGKLDILIDPVATFRSLPSVYEAIPLPFLKPSAACTANPSNSPLQPTADSIVSW